MECYDTLIGGKYLNMNYLRHSYWGEVFEYYLWHFISPDLKLLIHLPSRREKTQIIQNKYFFLLLMFFLMLVFYSLAIEH